MKNPDDAPPREKPQHSFARSGKRGETRKPVWCYFFAMLDAQHYRQQAEQMRKFAQDERNAATREQFLKLAAEYEKLAQRAEKRAAEAK
jgi:hypothetical protein